MAKFKLKGRVSALMASMAALTLLPSSAFADEPGLAGMTTVADTILSFLTGPIATAAGAIAIAFVGYRWFSGRMDIGKALATVAGIVLVIGSVQIVEFIRTGSGLTDSQAISSLEIEMPSTPLDNVRLYREFV